MSWKAQAHVLEMTEGINRTEKYVLFMLAYYHNDETHRCDPSMERLGGVLLMSARHVRRTIRVLEKKGMITTHERLGTSHQYDLNFLQTPDTDVRGDGMSGGTSMTPTPDTDVRKTKNITSLEDSSEEESSSSAEDEEDFKNRATAFYSPPPSSLLRSPILHPGRYFEEWRRNGDSLPVHILPDCKEVAEMVCEAVNVGYPEDRPVTLPHPLLLTGLHSCLGSIQRYSLQPKFLRLALFNFTEGDGVDPPELSGGDVLERMAKRPDLFAEALRQQSDALG